MPGTIMRKRAPQVDRGTSPLMRSTASVQGERAPRAWEPKRKAPANDQEYDITSEGKGKGMGIGPQVLSCTQRAIEGIADNRDA